MERDSLLEQTQHLETEVTKLTAENDQFRCLKGTSGSVKTKIILQSELNAAHSEFDAVCTDWPRCPISRLSSASSWRLKKKKSLKRYKAALAAEQKWMNETYAEFLQDRLA